MSLPGFSSFSEQGQGDFSLNIFSLRIMLNAESVSVQRGKQVLAKVSVNQCRKKIGFLQHDVHKCNNFSDSNVQGLRKKVKKN